jgi:hypothetical protein
MRRNETRNRVLRWSTYVAILALGGCAGEGGAPPAGSGSTGQPVSGTVDFERQIQPIFDAACSCHLIHPAPEQAFLGKGSSYAALVGVTSTQRPSLLRVKPEDPASSYLFVKIDPGSDSAKLRSGDLMPPRATPLSPDDIDLIRRWIQEGASPAAPTTDTTPPVFAGAVAAAAAGSFAVDVSWAAASDDTSAPGEISYRIYATKVAGGEDFSSPALVVRGVLSARVGDLLADTEWSFVVRAVDTAGNEDGNRVEVSARTPPETPPPPSVDFARDILPIFQASCVSCHSGGAPGSCEGLGGLCLESYAAIQGSAFDGTIIIPGNSAGSLLMKRIGPDLPPRMPFLQPPLGGEEIRLIGDWIDQGAKETP